MLAFDSGCGGQAQAAFGFSVDPAQHRPEQRDLGRGVGPGVTNGDNNAATKVFATSTTASTTPGGGTCGEGSNTVVRADSCPPAAISSCCAPATRAESAPDNQRWPESCPDGATLSVSKDTWPLFPTSPISVGSLAKGMGIELRCDACLLDVANTAGGWRPIANIRDVWCHVSRRQRWPGIGHNGVRAIRADSTIDTVSAVATIVTVGFDKAPRAVLVHLRRRRVVDRRPGRRRPVRIGVRA